MGGLAKSETPKGTRAGACCLPSIDVSNWVTQKRCPRHTDQKLPWYSAQVVSIVLVHALQSNKLALPVV